MWRDAIYRVSLLYKPQQETRSKKKPMIISLRKLEIIKAHARASFPEECCGILAGKTELKRNGDAENTVLEVAPCRNRKFVQRETGFEIAPIEWIEVEAEAKRLGYGIIGTYHSHTDFGAVPSTTDYEFSHAGHSNLIVAVKAGIIEDVRVWIHGDKEPFREEFLFIRL